METTIVYWGYRDNAKEMEAIYDTPNPNHFFGSSTFRGVGGPHARRRMDAWALAILYGIFHKVERLV